MLDFENQNLFSACISQMGLWGSACLMVYVNCCWFLGSIVYWFLWFQAGILHFLLLAMCFRWLNNKIQHEGGGENGVPILFRLQSIWLKPAFIGLYQYDLFVADFKTMVWILPSFLLLASTRILECLIGDSFFYIFHWCVGILYFFVLLSYDLIKT